MWSERRAMVLVIEERRKKIMAEIPLVLYPSISSFYSSKHSIISAFCICLIDFSSLPFRLDLG